MTDPGCLTFCGAAAVVVVSVYNPGFVPTDADVVAVSQVVFFAAAAAAAASCLSGQSTVGYLLNASTCSVCLLYVQISVLTEGAERKAATVAPDQTVNKLPWGKGYHTLQVVQS